LRQRSAADDGLSPGGIAGDAVFESLGDVPDGPDAADIAAIKR